MNSSFPNRWSLSYLKFTKYVTNIIAKPKYKYGQQEQVTVKNHNRSTALERSVLKILGGLNRFYGYPTSPSASVMEAVLRNRHTKPCPCPTLGHYILNLSPSAVSAETASVVILFQAAIVLGRKDNFSPPVYAFGR